MSRWDDAVIKISKLTRANEITWETLSDTLSYSAFNRSNIVGVAYFTSLEGKHLALYEIRYLDEDDNGAYYNQRVLIEFVTRDGRLEYQWPIEDAPARRLIELVRLRKSNASEFFDKLLKDDGERPKPKAKK